MINDGAFESSHQGEFAFCHLEGGRNKYNIIIFFEGKQTVQLDWTPSTSRRKINLPANQKGYDESDTTDEKLSARRIQIQIEATLISLNRFIPAAAYGMLRTFATFNR